MRVTEEKRDLLSKPHFQVPALLAVLVGLTYLGYYVTHLFAAGSAQLYLAPASGSLAVGSSVTVQVMVDAGAEQINTVEADLSYPASLQFVSIDATGSPFGIAAPSSGGGGTVKIARGNITPITGTALVAKIQFTVVGPGTASLPFLPSSAVVRASDAIDILGTATGASFSLSAPATPAPTPPPAPATTKPAAPVTPAPGKAKASPAPARPGSPTPAAPASPTPTATPAAPTASPTPVVSNNSLTPPVTTPAPTSALKKLTSPRLTLATAAAAAAVPILGLLIVAGLLLRRHKTPNFDSHPSAAGSGDPQNAMVYPDSHPDHPNNKHKPRE